MVKARFERYVVLAKRFGTRTVLFQDAAARHLDLTPTQLDCFRLVQHEGPLTASDLAQETGLTPASLSVIVDKLVERGLLTREQDRSDRRRWLLHATKTGAAMVDEVYAAHAKRVNKLLRTYSEEEFEVVLGFLDALSEELRFTAVELTRRGSERRG